MFDAVERGGISGRTGGRMTDGDQHRAACRLVSQSESVRLVH